MRDYIRNADADLICFQETKKSTFSNNELSSIAGADRFLWKFLPSSGHSGGILIRAKFDSFDFISFSPGVFFASMVVLHKALNVLWEVIVIYGPADHLLSHLFLDELHVTLSTCTLPFVLRGDFNLLRFPPDKNNYNLCWSRANAFNDFISDWALRELHRGGAPFT